MGKFEHHYLGVREMVLPDTCENMGSVWPEFLKNYDNTDEKCALGTAKFDSAGYAIYKNKDSPAQIYNDADSWDIHSIIDRAVSVHDDTYANPDLVDACCLIKPLDLSIREDRKKLRQLKRDFRESKRAIKERRAAK